MKTIQYYFRFIIIRFLAITGFLLLTTNTFSQDPNFYIYICFGQSNMQGSATIEDQDKTVDNRFQVLQALSCSNTGRIKGSWYTATPPLCRCETGLSPADYFGRTMAEYLPTHIKVGVINVSVAGCKIELFDKDNYQTYVSSVTEDWLRNIINSYNGNPYEYLVDLAQQAQEDGVIKGILLHQGESNTGDSQWPQKVKKIYLDLLGDLNLNSDSVPLLAGEVVHADQGGLCASMNSIIATLPQTIPNAHAISSSGCTDKDDNIHFNSAGCRELGNRYAKKMLSLMMPDVPYVYEVENTGDNFSKPVLPSFDELPEIELLPDPFEWSDGSGRDTSFVSWKKRRAEIKAEVEHYEIGEKPNRPEDITASYSEGTLTVNITVNENTLTLTSDIILPEGDGPFPAIIGMGSNTGSLPATLFSSKNIAQIPFNYGQVMAWEQNRGSEPINRLYPDLRYMGAYSAWSWGVSRLIDGLELVSYELPIDIKHLAVTGCSFAGKMALFAGAFDERIALTIAQESGGGGAAAWRVSETLGNVETLGNTSHLWFIEDLFKFSNDVSKLPYDHHELMAMVAPRALLLLGNPDYEWLAEESGYASCRAAHEVWKTFGIPDRFGFSIVDGHSHCQLPNSQKPEVSAFIDKFLLDSTDVNTFISTNPYDNVDYKKWYDWWNGGITEFPEVDKEHSTTVAFEAECARVGANWDIKPNYHASNKNYAVIKPGYNANASAPADSADAIYFHFTVDTLGKYAVYARVDCISGADDSFWVKMDDESFVDFNNLITNGWEWIKFDEYVLEKGEHVLTIAYREDGAKLDKISISNYLGAPEELGEEAINTCDPTTGIYPIKKNDGYELRQNYPNPYNEKTTIAFKIPKPAYVSLKVYNMLGEEIEELAGKKYFSGEHTVNFNSEKIISNNYYYIMKTDEFSLARKMVKTTN